MERQNIFPDLTQPHSMALEEQPVLLEGKKVLFETKVTLMPVELEETQHEDDEGVG